MHTIAEAVSPVHSDCGSLHPFQGPAVFPGLRLFCNCDKFGEIGWVGGGGDLESRSDICKYLSEERMVDKVVRIHELAVNAFF